MLLTAALLRALVSVAAAMMVGGGIVGLYATLTGRTSGTQTREDLCAHRYIRGATGCGKSTYLSHLFAGACEAGDGAWWISTHGGESMLDVVPGSRVKDVVYLAPASARPLGFNLFKRYTCEAIEANLIADQTTRLFELLFERSWGDRIAEMVNAAALAWWTGARRPPCSSCTAC